MNPEVAIRLRAAVWFTDRTRIPLHPINQLSSYNAKIAANTPTIPATDTPTRRVSAAAFEVLDDDALAVEEPEPAPVPLAPVAVAPPAAEPEPVAPALDGVDVAAEVTVAEARQAFWQVSKALFSAAVPFP